ERAGAPADVEVDGQRAGRQADVPGRGEPAGEPDRPPESARKPAHVPTVATAAARRPAMPTNPRPPADRESPAGGRSLAGDHPLDEAEPHPLAAFDDETVPLGDVRRPSPQPPRLGVVEEQQPPARAQ